MVDLIILIFLAWEIGRLAAKKGLKVFTWRVYTVLGWLTGEIIGLAVGVMLFGSDNIISIILVGITFGVTSYFLIKNYLNKLPDKRSIDDDINNIGK